jgi:hypothetical protein
MAEPAEHSNSLPVSIIILGAAKSGTTALFYAIRKALESGYATPTQGLFEPGDSARIADYLKGGPDAVPLVKVLMGPQMRRNPRVVDKFDRRIVIHRDPRDNIVSRIVFMVQNFVRPREGEKIEQLLAIFREKERDPAALSILEMLRRIEAVTGREGLAEMMRDGAVQPGTLKRERPDDFFFLPYADLVAGEFAALNTYLGMTVTPDFEVDAKHAYVVRTKAAGSWRDWFLREDIRFFVVPVKEEYRILGYDPSERPLRDKERRIDPAKCSDYVAQQFARQAAKKQSRRQARRAEGRKVDAAA